MLLEELAPRSPARQYYFTVLLPAYHLVQVQLFQVRMGLWYLNVGKLGMPYSRLLRFKILWLLLAHVVFHVSMPIDSILVG